MPPSPYPGCRDHKCASRTFQAQESVLDLIDTAKLSSGVQLQLTLGKRFATPVITPVPPVDRAGTSQSLCPAKAQKSLGSNSALILATLAMPPQVNLTPTMFWCFPSFESISELTSSPATTPG